MPTIPCTVIGTDNGKSWSVWSCCLEMGGNVTTMWSVMSRAPTMDAALEQKLVEYIETVGGVSREKLRGIGQTDCHNYIIDE